MQEPRNFEWLMNAINRHDINGVIEFLDQGTDINGKTQDGTTPLMCAASQGGHSGIVRLLLERGADFYVRDNQGRSALDCAFGKRIRECLTARVDERYIEDERRIAEDAQNKRDILLSFAAVSKVLSPLTCPRCRGSKYQRTGGGGVKPCALCNQSGLNPDASNPNYR